MIPGLRVLGNLILGYPENAQLLLSMGLMDQYARLVDHPKLTIRREVCWALSNLMIKSPEGIGRMLDHAPVMGKLMAMLTGDQVDVIPDKFQSFCLNLMYLGPARDSLHIPKSRPAC